MADMPYVCLYTSYLETLDPYNDAQRGRILTAMLDYAVNGKEPSFKGNERFIWPMIKGQIDRDVEAYTLRKERNKANGAKGGRPKKQSDEKENPENPAVFSGTQKSQLELEGELEGEGELKGDSSPPIPPAGGNPPRKEPEIDLSCLSPTMQAKLMQWLAYKKERRESYKPTGLQALVTRIRSAADSYGDTAVCDLIDNSMSSGYQGILFDRLQQQSRVKNAMTPPTSSTPTARELEAVQRMMNWKESET